jgi:hypothetical protein
VRYFGILTLDVARQALDAAVAEPANSSSTLVLLDTREALVHEVDVDWLRAYQAYKSARCYPSQITALVVSRDESHQLLGQLWAAIRATTTPRSPGVFTDESAAVEWLLAQREAGGARTMTA